ncbi:MAG: acriflavin resistance protein [Candidatus Hydrogenedentota bacterium]
MPPPDVTVIEINAKTLPVSYEYVGVTEASKTVEIRARVQGFLESRDFEEGALIEEGTKLFTIDQRPFEADKQIAAARVDQAQTRVKLAEQEVKRLQSVNVPGAIAESDLDRQLADQSDAAASLKLAKAQLAKAELELGYTVISAPLKGYVGKAQKEIGSLVDASQNSLLTVMHQVDPIYVSFQVSEREYLSMRNDEATGRIILAGDEKPYLEITLLDGTVYTEKGTIDFESTSVDLDSGSVEIRGTFRNAEHTLKPGQFVRAHIRGWQRPGTIAIPQRAVSQSPQGAYVYVVAEGNKAEFRSVKPGAWVGQDWIIDDGLAEGEKVIVEGLMKVQPGIVVNPVKTMQTSSNTDAE